MTAAMDFNRFITTAAFPELAEFFLAEGMSVCYPRGAEFARQQCRNRHCGLVEAGAFRYVRLTDGGVRHVVGYAFAGEFVGDYISMCNDLPAWVGIEAMCDSRVLRLDDERLFEAAKNLFARRTANSSPGIGWSAAWAMCLAARFCDKKQAERAFYGFTSRSLLPGLYGFHPPCYFQIDGNLGWTAAINETLLTRKNGKLVFLPALLDVMPSGSMRGMLVEGAKLDFSWENGKVTSARADKPLQAYDLNFSGGAQLQNITLFPAKDI